MAKNIKVGQTVYTVSWIGEHAGRINKEICDGYKEDRGEPEWHTNHSGDNPEMYGWLNEREIFATKVEAKKAYLKWYIEGLREGLKRWKKALRAEQRHIEKRERDLAESRKKLAKLK